MKLRKNDQGFSAVETLLILAILGIIGFVGYFVYHSQKATDKTLSQTGNSTAPTLSKKSSTTNSGYLTIKEWGVKVPQLPEGNSISYQFETVLPDSVRFVSSEQRALGGDCGTFPFSRVSITRKSAGYVPRSENDNDRPLKHAADNGLELTIGKHSYFIIGDMTGGDCTEKGVEGTAMSQQEITANSDLVNDLKALTAN